MIPNDQILYLKQVKDDPPRNPPLKSRVLVRVRVGHVRVRAVYKRALKSHDLSLSQQLTWVLQTVC